MSTSRDDTECENCCRWISCKSFLFLTQLLTEMLDSFAMFTSMTSRIVETFFDSRLLRLPKRGCFCSSSPLSAFPMSILEIHIWLDCQKKRRVLLFAHWCSASCDPFWSLQNWLNQRWDRIYRLTSPATVMKKESVCPIKADSIRGFFFLNRMLFWLSRKVFYEMEWIFFWLNLSFSVLRSPRRSRTPNNFPPRLGKKKKDPPRHILARWPLNSDLCMARKCQEKAPKGWREGPKKHILGMLSLLSPQNQSLPPKKVEERLVAATINLPFFFVKMHSRTLPPDQDRWANCP